MFSEENDIIMKLRAEHFAGPLFAVLTLAIGVGVVRAAQALESFFDVPAAVIPQENIGVTSTENFKSFSASEDAAVKGRVLACYDMTILPVWTALKEDEDFKDRLSQATGLMNCSDLIEVKRVDMNRDGNDEFLVRGKPSHLCSPTGNCAFWVFQMQGARPRKVLSDTEYYSSQLGDQVAEPQTRGFSNVLLKYRYSSSHTRYTTFAFDGAKFIESRCMDELPKEDRSTEGAWSLVPCGVFGDSE